MLEWCILAWQTLNASRVEVGVQNEGPRLTLRVELKQILPPTASTPSSQMIIQIKFVYKEQERQLCRGKEITQGQSEQPVSHSGDKWSPCDFS